MSKKEKLMAYTGYPESEHAVRLMTQDPKALALEWIKAYAAQLNGDTKEDDEYDGTVSHHDLIDTAMTQVEAVDGWGDYLCRGGLLEGVQVESLFWDKLAILKDIEIPQEKRNDFFSCSC